MTSLISRLKIALKTSDADRDALRFLDTDKGVRVSAGKTIEYRPLQVPVKAGIVFYQGGRCDPLAYGAVLQPLAAAGFPVFVPRMPLRMAVLGANKVAGVMAANPRITKWFIGGHSMGGAMAAGFASKRPEDLSGLFLLGSYAAGMHAMPDSPLPVLFVHGTEDDQVRSEEVAAQPQRLPPNTRFVEIDGGDHYQFGSFSDEWVTARISRDEQQRRTVAEVLDFLDAVCGTGA